jgi:hypothetical protein
MAQLLNGTNCNQSGVFVHRINKGGPTKVPTQAPSVATTKAPTKARTFLTKVPTKSSTKSTTFENCGLLGWNLLCPRTLCRLFRHLLGFCKDD